MGEGGYDTANVLMLRDNASKCTCVGLPPDKHGQGGDIGPDNS